MTLAVGVVVIAALYVGREVFIPIVLAILLSFVLAPIVDLMRRIHLGRVPAVLVAVLLALSIIIALGGLVGVQIAQLAGDLPRYQETIAGKVEDLRDATIGRANDLIKNLGRQIEQTTNQAHEDTVSSPDRPGGASRAPEQPLPVQVREREKSAVEVASALLGPILHPLATTGIVLVIAIFILLQREDLRDRAIRLLGSGDLHRTTMAMDDATRRLSRYFLTQIALNASFGILITIGLSVIGVPSPVLCGIFAALMRFVPYIGAFIAAALPLALAAAVDPSGWSMALWTLALFGILEPIMGQAIEPMVYGHSTGMSPFAVVIAAIFWTWLWGPIGLLLATPFTVILVVLGRHIEGLEFLDVILGDRPALTPDQSFYQRILAGDPDEAQEHAEVLLEKRALSSYYDEVALKGLQLAANDARRGVLSRARLEVIRQAIWRLVQDLSEYDDVEPSADEKKEAKEAEPARSPRSERKLPERPPDDRNVPPPEALPLKWRNESAILCLAGRGVLDEGAAAMLAQLLQKHGFGAKMLPHDAASRERLSDLDVSQAAMICISYLEISGNPSHLRYLIRRLRQKTGRHAKILVGLWPADDEILQDEGLRSQVGADYYVISLREAVKTCLDQACASAGALNGAASRSRTNELSASRS